MNLPYKWVINHTSDKNLHIFCKIKISFGVPHFVIICTYNGLLAKWKPKSESIVSSHSILTAPYRNVNLYQGDKC